MNRKYFEKNNSKLTIHLHKDLIKRLQREAKHQGVSLNQLTNYLLNSQITLMESVSILESRIAQKNFSSLKRRVKKILSKVPAREAPDWDKL